MTATVEYIDHTGDTGVIVTAHTIEKVFAIAAKSMFHIICPQNNRSQEVTRIITIQGKDREQLLVDWLSELNYLFQTESFLLSQINSLSLNGKSLTARVCGDTAGPEVHDIRTEIKAVTFHQLYIKQINGSWQAQIIFDI